jgi:mRNA degradation ribonuclease J1/J2
LFCGTTLYHLHISGQIMPQDLREIVVRVGQKRVTPIHTDHPELFGKFISQQNEGVTQATYGVPIDVS